MHVCRDRRIGQLHRLCRGTPHAAPRSKANKRLKPSSLWKIVPGMIRATKPQHDHFVRSRAQPARHARAAAALSDSSSGEEDENEEPAPAGPAPVHDEPAQAAVRAEQAVPLPSPPGLRVDASEAVASLQRAASPFHSSALPVPPLTLAPPLAGAPTSSAGLPSAFLHPPPWQGFPGQLPVMQAHLQSQAATHAASPPPIMPLAPWQQLPDMHAAGGGFLAAQPDLLSAQLHSEFARTRVSPGLSAHDTLGQLAADQSVAAGPRARDSPTGASADAPANKRPRAEPPEGARVGRTRRAVRGQK